MGAFTKVKGRKAKTARALKRGEMPMKKGKKSSREKFIRKAEDALGDLPV